MAVDFYTVGAWEGPTRRAVAYTVSTDREIQFFTVKGMLEPDNSPFPPPGGHNYITALEWEVRSGGVTGTLLANGNIPFEPYKNGLVPYRTVEFSIRLDEPLAHSAGVTYYFILKTPSDTQNCRYWWSWAYDSTGSHEAYAGGAGGWYTVSSGKPYLRIPATMAGVKYHIVIGDKGYMTPDLLRSFVEQMAQSPVAKIAVATKELSDLAFPYSTHSQSSWHRGRGEYEVALPDGYWWGNADTTCPRQAILAPQAKRTTVEETNPHHGPTQYMPMVTLPSFELTSDPQHPVRYFAQKFTLAANTTITKLHTYLRGWGGDGTVYLEVWTDNAGVPGSLISGCQVNLGSHLDPAGKWRGGDVATPYTAGGADETLWFVLRTTGEGGARPDILTRVDSAGGAPGGSLQYSADGTTWTEWAGHSMWFRVNDGSCQFSLYRGVVKLIEAEFGGTKYLFALSGTAVYRWNEGVGYWELVRDFGSGVYVYDAAFFADKLWVSAASNVWSYDGTNWADSGVAGFRLYVAQGYLWRSGLLDNKLYKTNDGANWSAAIVVGDSTTHITGIAEYQGELHVAKEDGVWYVDKNDLAFLRIPYPDQAWMWNGFAMMPWGGYLWINVQTDLWRWNGSRVDMKGPNQGHGLPHEVVGPILTLAGSARFLFAATYSVTGGKTALLAYDGIGWHCLYATPEETNIRSAIWTADIGDEYRLWFGEGGYVRYMTFPVAFTNRYEWPDATYHPMCQLIESWWYGGLRNVKKHIRRMLFDVDGLDNDNGTFIDVYYKVDSDEDDWHYLGTLTEDYPDELEFPTDFECFAIQLAFNFWTANSKKSPRLKGWGLDAVARPRPIYQVSVRILLADGIRDMTGVPISRSAQQMWEELKELAQQVAPVLVHHPWGSFMGLISHLGAVPIRYKATGAAEGRWERAAEITFILV